MPNISELNNDHKSCLILLCGTLIMSPFLMSTNNIDQATDSISTVYSVFAFVLLFPLTIKYYQYNPSVSVIDDDQLAGRLHFSCQAA